LAGRGSNPRQVIDDADHPRKRDGNLVAVWEIFSRQRSFREEMGVDAEGSFAREEEDKLSCDCGHCARAKAAAAQANAAGKKERPQGGLILA
jgi:hypothetical protein